jgi:hypothetical protein
MTSPSIDVITSSTLALEGYRARLVRVFDMLDDAAEGRIELPLEADRLDGVISDCIQYLLVGDEQFKATQARLLEHLAKVEELRSLDREVEEASRALSQRCQDRAARSAELDAASRAAAELLVRLDRAMQLPADLDTLVRAAERSSFTSRPPRGWDPRSHAHVPLEPMLPGRPGEAEFRASLLYRLQVCCFLS